MKKGKKDGGREGRRERGRERERSKDSCYWWLLGGQHASSVTLTTRPDRIVRFCERREIAAAFSGRLTTDGRMDGRTRAIALLEKRTCRAAPLGDRFM